MWTNNYNAQAQFLLPPTPFSWKILVLSGHSQPHYITCCRSILISYQDLLYLSSKSLNYQSPTLKWSLHSSLPKTAARIVCKTSDSNVTLLPLWLWPQSEWLQMCSNLQGLPWSSVRRPSDLTSCSSVLAPCALAMPAVFAITSGSAFNMRPSTPSFCSWPSYLKLQLQSHTPASVPCPPNTSSFCLFGLIYLFTIEIASSVAQVGCTPNTPLSAPQWNVRCVYTTACGQGFNRPESEAFL